MKRELTRHLAVFLIFFLLVNLLRGWFYTEILIFWLGGIIGTFLPDIDHYIYAYYLRPAELTSRRVNNMIENKQYIDSAKLLVHTKEERETLIFHTIIFQLVFAFLTIFVVTSSGSLFGRGLVTAFSLHLLVDNYEEYKKKGQLDRWVQRLPISLDNANSKKYLSIMVLLLVVVSLFF